MDDLERAKNHFAMGIEYFNSKNYPRAESEFLIANNLVPDRVSILTNLTAVMIKQGKYREALFYAERSTQLDSLNTEGWINLAICHINIKQFHQAMDAVNKLLEIDPENFNGLYYKADIYIQQHEYGSAIQSCDTLTKFIKKHPEMATTQRHMLTQIEICKFYSLILTCSHEQLPNELENISRSINDLFSSSNYADLPPPLIELCNTYLFCLNYLDSLNESNIYNWHLAWARFYENKNSQSLTTPVVINHTRPLRIGYVSPDFREHPVSQFFKNIAIHHGKEFEIFCYATFNQEDNVTELIRSKIHTYHDVSNIAPEKIAAVIQQDGIDILIHLGGYTAHSNPQVLTYRPAPIQILYLGYPNTSGASFVDYWITDKYAHLDDTFNTEKLIRLPESFLCFGSFEDVPREIITPAKTSRVLTFGSFNNAAKLSALTIRLWSKLLSSIPNSKLLIKSMASNSPLTRSNIVSAFKENSINEDRIIFSKTTSSRSSHLELYNQIDIALDTMPYNGTTTTCEALWMGVPVLTLVGQTHRQRVSYSILKNIGVEDTIAYSEDEFVEIGKGLATDLEALSNLRKRVADGIRNSILCNPKKFTLQFEQILLDIYEKYYWDFISNKHGSF